MVVAGTHHHLIATVAMVVVGGVHVEYRGTLNLEVVILYIINLVGFSSFPLHTHG